MERFSVALVNDYEVVVKGWAAMLRTYHDVVDVVELDLNKHVASVVDVALYDTFAAVQRDSPGVRALAANPQVGKVAVYSWNLDEVTIRDALDKGAAGYISKGLPARDLVAALSDIHNGTVDVFDGGKRSGSVVAGDWPGREEGLTPREAEILALLTQGLSNNEIAQRAFLSVNSVKTHLRSCYRRIGVNSRTNALLWGLKHGFKPDHVRIEDPDSDLEDRSPA